MAEKKTDTAVSSFIPSHTSPDFAAMLGLEHGQLEFCGRDMAKIPLSVLEQLRDRPNGRYILVTGMNPTTAGDGKTVTTIGLSMALNRLGKKAIATLRQPSMGPVFGRKGGGTGGGKATVVPMEHINLHFTGDIHAVTSAHNLLAAYLENSLRGKNPLRPIRCLLEAFAQWSAQNDQWRIAVRKFRSAYRLAVEYVRLHGGGWRWSGLRHLAALVSDAVKENPLNIDPPSITWRWVIDLNARPLRDIETSLRETQFGVPLVTGFDISTASEVMAILALARNLKDLRERLGRIVVAETFDGRPVTAEDIGIAGAMTALLINAIKPNVVRTLENTPVLIHTGPFGNIAHGCCSILADELALKLADYAVTEAGFGSDLGAEKFFNIKCRASGLAPHCAVIVCSMRALKLHSGDYAAVPASQLMKRLQEPALDAIRKGFANLRKHIENIRKFGLPTVVAINRFPHDSGEELALAAALAKEGGADEAEVSDVYARGGEGGEALARAVMRAAERESHFRFLYDEHLSIREKIECIAREIYGASGVKYSPRAQERIALFTARGYGRFPICMAKTHLSLSHDPTQAGRPEGFVLPVEDIRASVGAGFLYPLCGEIVTMPGLPGKAIGHDIDIDVETGRIKGMF